jgi:hypothetical protein
LIKKALERIKRFVDSLSTASVEETRARQKTGEPV